MTVSTLEKLTVQRDIALSFSLRILPCIFQSISTVSDINLITYDLGNVLYKHVETQ